MANTIITPDMIAHEALFLLENSMVMGNNVYREYVKEFAKVGDTVRIRKPVKFAVTESATASIQDVTEYYTHVKISTQAHVAWQFSSQELTLDIDRYSELYIQPAAARLANLIDEKLCGLYDDVWNQVGTPGSTPNAFSDLADVAQRLDEYGVPNDARRLVLNPAAHWSMADALKGLYDTKLTKDTVRKGYLGTIAGMDVLMDQNIKAHTTGTFTTGSTPLTNGASSAGDTTITTDGWAASTLVLKAGDVFTIAGVYDVNPMSGEAYSYLKQFVALSDVTSDAGGNATITIFPTTTETHPGLQASGAYKNVSALPADNAAITPVGTEATAYPINMGFHKNAFALAVVPLEMPAGVWGSRKSYNGLSIRVIKDYDFTNDKERIRMDVLFGEKTVYPELACRLIG